MSGRSLHGWRRDHRQVFGINAARRIAEARPTARSDGSFASETKGNRMDGAIGAAPLARAVALLSIAAHSASLAKQGERLLVCSGRESSLLGPAACESGE